MPKMKTRNSLSRRFRLTKKGKIIHRQSFARHLKRKKSKAQLRRLRQPKSVGRAVNRKLKKLLRR